MIEYGVGIDPGWKNLGFAIVKNEDGKIERIHTETINPFVEGAFKVAEHIANVVKNLGQDIVVKVQMERYVAYKGVTSADSEHILMMIGQLQHSLRQLNTVQDIEMMRAIDWKTELVHLLFRYKGFDNPSTKLDKKFSKAASSCCLGITKETKTDHEADATCLASIPFIRVVPISGVVPAATKSGPAIPKPRSRAK